jgi:hypothetical protein
MCQIQSIHSSPRRTPTAKAAVPGGWIDLTREGFYYAYYIGILSFSVVAQSLVNGPYGVTMAKGETELPDFFTQFEGHKQHRLMQTASKLTLLVKSWQ